MQLLICKWIYRSARRLCPRALYLLLLPAVRPGFVLLRPGSNIYGGGLYRGGRELLMMFCFPINSDSVPSLYPCW